MTDITSSEILWIGWYELWVKNSKKLKVISLFMKNFNLFFISNTIYFRINRKRIWKIRTNPQYSQCNILHQNCNILQAYCDYK